MISVTLSQLTDILNGELQGADITLDAVTTDTRKLTPGCLFVALKGERFDAHDFADRAKAGGAGALLVSRPLDIDLPQLIVKDTRLAFGELAAWVRQQVPARVVALTGSSGKTSVKEMTAAILSQCGNTLYTAGNLNNDIGVPMTLLRLTPEYDFAVIELGANHQGELFDCESDSPGSGAGQQPQRHIWKVLARLRVSRKRKVKSLAACRKTVSPS